jgi:glycosyltransferase involved in cell wall biosynthesis
MMKTIVHISADFPDPLVPGKTKAVQSLIEAAPSFRHVVYSLNRVSWRSGMAVRPFGNGHLAIAYGAAPYGVRLQNYLSPVADLILDDLGKRGLVPDLIHAHKFTVDGLGAQRVAQHSRSPFIASIWGGTDRRIFQAKPGLRGAFQAIARDAVLLLPASPWTGEFFAGALELDPGKLELLPVITKTDAILPPVYCDAPRLLSVFAFDSWKRKGFHRLVRAVGKASAKFAGISLDVFGRGGPKALIDMTGHIRRAGLGARVTLKSAVEHGEVQNVMNQYAGFVLPSRPETYGMVYAEALLAGAPVLWSQNEGIDGLFNDAGIGYCCDPQSTDDIAAGLCHLLAEQRSLKDRIARMQAEGGLDLLRQEAIGARYRQLISFAIGAKAQATASAA